MEAFGWTPEAYAALSIGERDEALGYLNYKAYLAERAMARMGGVR